MQFNGTLNVGYDLSYTYSTEEGKKFQLENVKDVNYRTVETPEGNNVENGHVYTYDKNGNLVYVNTSRMMNDGHKDNSVGERKLIWDEENRLLSVDDNGFVSNYWYDADGERTVKTSGESDQVYVNGVFSGGSTNTAKFSLYVSPYLVANQGGRYTKHIYAGSQRIVSKVGDFASYGSDPRRIEYAGSETDGLSVDYKSKYTAQQQVIKDHYQFFDVPYNGTDNNNYADGEGFCCNDGTLEAAQAKAMRKAQSRAVAKSFKDPDNYENLQFFYHPDHLGSSSFITNLDGDVVQHIEYVPFGEVFIEERNNVWNTPYLFNAKEFDEETGMYYYGARYYDPRLSLWTSTDPMQEKAPYMSSYVFCHNNPINWIDPDGLTDYFNENGNFIKTVEDASDRKVMIFISNKDSKNADKVNNAIAENRCMTAPSLDIITTMEEAYKRTEKTGNEHGFRVGKNGTISQIVEGRKESIDGAEWAGAIKDLTDNNDRVSYDVHTHPKPKYEPGSGVLLYNNQPSETDIQNTVGNSPNIVLGYTMVQEPRSSNTIGGEPKIRIEQRIRFFDRTGAINSDQYRFSDFKNAVKKILKWQPKK